MSSQFVRVMAGDRASFFCEAESYVVHWMDHIVFVHRLSVDVLAPVSSAAVSMGGKSVCLSPFFQLFGVCAQLLDWTFAFHPR